MANRAITGAQHPVAICICFVLLVMGSCRSGDSSGPSGGMFSDRLHIVSGDNQLGTDRTPLEQPVVQVHLLLLRRISLMLLLF